MTGELLIAGFNKRDNLIKNSLSITAELNKRTTCSFSLWGGAPTEGQEVRIADGPEIHFGGIVKKVVLLETIDDINIWRVDCLDYAYQLDRLFVVEEYSEQNADDIARDIVIKYCAGFTVVGIQSGAPQVEYLSFDDRRPSDCLNELAEYVGWRWYIDHTKDVHFFNPQDIAESAPMVIEDGAHYWRFRPDIDITGLANRIRVRGGSMLSDLYTHEIKADGKARIWILPHKPKQISMTVNAVPVTVGIEHIHEEGTHNYYLNYQEKYIRADDATGTIADGTTITFTYKCDIPVITVVEDFESQAAVAAVQGGDGAYEYVIKDDTLETLGAAEAAGNQYLREHANPKVSGTFETEVGGWKPGQLVVINLPDQGIQGTYMVQRITVRNLDQAEQTYNIQWGGRLLGIADFLRALVAKEQKKRLAETTLLSKYTYGLERVEVLDEMDGTHRLPPWICGDADAICGFVVAAEVETFFLAPFFPVEIRP